MPREHSLLAACRGVSSIFVPAGDAGVAKTRLCAESGARGECRPGSIDLKGFANPVAAGRIVAPEKAFTN